MATEIELKLQIDAKSVRALPSQAVLASITPRKQHLLNTYYDTPNLDLHARRIAVRFRKKGWEWLLTVKTAEPASGGLAVRSEWETAATPGTFDFSHVDNDELRHFLESKIGQLEPVFTTDFNRQTWLVPFGESTIELACDRGHVESKGKRLPIRELELELLSGQTTDIFGLTRKLQEELWLKPAIASKAERGYDLFLDTPLRPVKARPSTITADMTPVEAFRHIALDCLEHYLRNEHGVLTSSDPEFTHQARVALRRLRTAIKLFAPVLPEEFISTYSEAWKVITNTLGAVRNWDVFISETIPHISQTFPDNKDIQRIERAAPRHREIVHKITLALLDTAAYRQLLVEFSAASNALSNSRAIRLKELAFQQVSRHKKRAQMLSAKVSELNSDEQHKMRIVFKKLRYTLEFFACFFPQESLKSNLMGLSKIQDQLGLINDHVTAKMLITEILPKHPDSVFAGWVSGRHALLLGNLPNALDSWRNRPLPQ
jgi:triphosphatase